MLLFFLLFLLCTSVHPSSSLWSSSCRLSPITDCSLASPSPIASPSVGRPSVCSLWLSLSTLKTLQARWCHWTIQVISCDSITSCPCLHPHYTTLIDNVNNKTIKFNCRYCVPMGNTAAHSGHIRKPLPSCVVSAIRSQFPEGEGIYKGLKRLSSPFYFFL